MMSPCGGEKEIYYFFWEVAKDAFKSLLCVVKTEIQGFVLQTFFVKKGGFLIEIKQNKCLAAFATIKPHEKFQLKK